MQLTSDEMCSLVDLAEELCGLYLDDSKGYLVESRLQSLVTKYGCATYREFVDLARQTSSQPVRDEIVDAITTNETLFFRDDSPFNALRFKIIPELIDQVESGKRPKQLRIWSAACSTGQEAYSLAIVLTEMIPDIASWDIQVLGTDVSQQAVARAREGWYSDLEAGRGLSEATRSQYFTRQRNGWQVNANVASLAKFESRNLLEPFPERDHFDIVFCRNVAIYFRQEQRDSIFRRIAGSMRPGGVLFIGSAESLANLGVEFTPQIHCESVLYRPRGNEWPTSLAHA